MRHRVVFQWVKVLPSSGLTTGQLLWYASLHLGIKAFFGTTESPVKTSAIATHVMIAIIKKRLNSDHALYKNLPELYLNMFDTIATLALLGGLQDEPETGQNPI